MADASAARLQGEVMQRIEAARRDRQFAAADLTRLLYVELRKLAASMLARRNAPISFHPTSLVHEVFLKLVGRRDPGWDGRSHFFGAAAQAMRELVVDEIRRRRASKRGGHLARVTLTDVPGTPLMDEQILQLHKSLDRLAVESARKGQIVVLRYFAGFTVSETAELLGVSLATVERDWRYARAWLRTEMAGG